MVAPMLIYAAVTAAASAYGSMKAGKDAKKAGAKRDQLQEQALGLMKSEKDRQDALYGPIETRIAKDLGNDNPREWGLIKGDLTNSFQDARRRTSENLAANGSEGTGIGAALSQGLDINEAQTKSRAYVDALERLKGQRFSFLSRYNPAGLVAGMAGQNNFMSNTAQQDKMQADGQEQQGWQAFGNALYQGGMHWNDKPDETPKTTPNPDKKIDPAKTTPNPDKKIDPAIRVISQNSGAAGGQGSAMQPAGQAAGVGLAQGAMDAFSKKGTANQSPLSVNPNSVWEDYWKKRYGFGSKGSVSGAGTGTGSTTK